MQDIDSKINGFKPKMNALEMLRGIFCLLTLYLVVGTDCLFTFRGFNLFAVQKAQAQFPYLQYWYAAFVLAMICALAVIYYYAMRIRGRFSIVWQLLLTLYGACAMFFCASYNAFLPLMISQHVLSKITWFTMARYSPVMFWLVIAVFKFGCLIMSFASASVLPVKCLILTICGAALLLASYKCTALKVWLDGLVVSGNRSGMICANSASAVSLSRRFWSGWFRVATLLMVVVFVGHLGAIICDWLPVSDLSFLRQYQPCVSMISMCRIILILLVILPAYYLLKKNSGHKILIVSMSVFTLWILSMQFQCKMMGSATALNIILALVWVVKALCLLELARLSFIAFVIGSFLAGVQGMAPVLTSYPLIAGGFDLLWCGYLTAGVVVSIMIVIDMQVFHDNSSSG